MGTSTDTSIKPLENFDPLGRFFKRSLRLTPFSYGLLIFLADVIVDAFIGFRWDIFFSNSTTPGLLEDYMALIVDFVSNPVLGGLYLWSLDGTIRLFRQLQNSKIFTSEDAIEDIVDKNRHMYRHPAAFVIILILSLVFMITQAGGYLGWMPWESVGGYLELVPQASYLRAPFWFLSFYNILFAIYNIGVTIIILRGTFRKKDIRLIPLHPDGCGGLGAISQYTIRIAYGIAVVGLIFTAAVLIELQTGGIGQAYSVIIGIGFYSIAAPLIFFWPLGTAHEAMQDAKDSELLSLATQFDEVYSKVKIDEQQNFADNMERLKQLKDLYQVAEEFPVWPFDFRSLRRFFTVVGTPLIPAIISIGIEILKNLITSP